MKVCTKCEVEKPEIDFHIKRRSTGKLHSWCKPCQRLARHRSYLKRRSYYLAKSKECRKQYVNRARDVVRALKCKPCTDCGQQFHFCAMDFDHVKGTKKFMLSRFSHSKHGIEKLKVEAAKCDVVCSNCHRIRTHNRRIGIRGGTRTH